MALYTISYDLKKVRNYQSLYDLLGRWGAVRLLESQWLVEHSGSAATVRDHIRSAVDNDDGIAVIQIFTSSGWATINVQPAGVAWLKNKLGS